MQIALWLIMVSATRFCILTLNVSSSATGAISVQEYNKQTPGGYLLESGQ